ncbi:MAG TPA: glycosyltransferase family 4 protein [Candidatus Saccharimonadales bacterium]|nr:glycosyltransferase family 4 protein [Candidatus Saccharimonadales bacterium]
MRIATMVKGYLTVPTPPDIIYAPADLALQISDGLIERGHSVDFYAPVGSRVGEAHLVSRDLHPLANNYDEFQALLVNPAFASDNVLATWDSYLAAEMFRRADKGEYDILFFHHPEAALPFVKIYPHIPVVYTMHDPIEILQQGMLEMHASPGQHLISISDKQRETAPDFPYLQTIYNGIDIDYFTPGTAAKEEYLLFLGSILPRKGTKEAIEVAQKSGRPLIIAGPTYPDNQDYFDTYVAPYIDGTTIQYLGHVPHNQTAELFQKAAAFLMPIQWEEPFGLTIAEAMACGTPVIALNRGSVPEIIHSGVTGFIASSIDEMAEAVAKLDTIDLKACRKAAVERFSTKAMVDSYEQAFLKLLGK